MESLLDTIIALTNGTNLDLYDLYFPKMGVQNALQGDLLDARCYILCYYSRVRYAHRNNVGMYMTLV